MSTPALVPCASCNAPVAPTARFCPQCGMKLQSDEEIEQHDPYLGLVIGSRYRLEELIGTGASGRVYRGAQLSIGKSFAVKLLKPQLTSDPSWKDRFASEARNAAKLNHPNIVSIVDHGLTDQGASYLVMEYVEGRPLETIIREDYPLTRPRITDIVLQILAALTEAHDLRILHRDLKPENILVQQLRTHGEHVKILDFGIATLLDSDNDRATDSHKPATLCGTPEYMSPEQALGDTLDSRSDLYAVGIILYEMLTGCVPFVGESAAEILHKQVDQTPTRPSQLTGTNFGQLEEVCLRALSKDAEQRYASAQAFREAILAASHLDNVGSRKCPACRHPATEKDQFCVQCGNQLDRPPDIGSTLADFAAIAIPLRQPARPTTGGSLPPAQTIRRTSIAGLVGREGDVQRMLDFLSPASNGLRSATFLGESGMGLTRTLQETAARLRKQGFVVYAVGCEPSGFAPPLWPIRHIVASILDVNLGTVTARELGRANNLLGGSIECLPGLAQLFGLGGPISEAELAVRRRECIASTVEAVLAAGRGSPLALVFDDVHDYDHASREILARLCRSQTEHVVRVMISTHTAVLAPTSDLTIELHGLTPREVRAIVSQDPRFGNPDSHAWLAKLQEGEKLSPLQVSFLSRVSPHVRDVAPSLPHQLASIWLQSVSSEAQQILQCASVLGRRVHRDDIRTLHTAGGAPAAVHTFALGLSELESEGLLTSSGGDLYEFIHGDVWSATYDSLAPGRRSYLHGQAAIRSETALEDVHVRALHVLRSGSHESTDALIEAADLAASRFDDYTAAELLRAALRSCDARGQDIDLQKRTEVVVRLTWILRYADGIEQAIRILNQELDRVKARPQLHARLSKQLGKILMRQERYNPAVRAFRSALAVATARGARDELIELYTDIGHALFSAGQAKLGLQEMLEGLDLCTLGEGPRAAVDFDLWRYLIEVSDLMMAVGRLREAKMWCEHALYQAERRSRPLGILRSTVQLSRITRSLSQHDLSEQYAARAIERARHLGDRRTVAELLIERASLAIRELNPHEARIYLDEASELVERIEWTDGLKLIDEARQHLATIGTPHTPAAARTGSD